MQYQVMPGRVVIVPGGISIPIWHPDTFIMEVDTSTKHPAMWFEVVFEDRVEISICGDHRSSYMDDRYTTDTRIILPGNFAGWNFAGEISRYSLVIVGYTTN